MSSILKALKKLEHERARRQEGPLDLARDILRGEPRRGGILWLLPAVVGLLVVTAGAVLFLRATPPQATIPQPASIPGPVAAPAIAPVRAAGPAAVPSGDAAIIEEIVDPRRPAAAGNSTFSAPARAVATATETQPKSSAPAAAAAVPAPAAAVKAASSAGNAGLPGSANSPVLPTRAAADVGLLVSGIAWQQAPEERLAVVNDLPVMEGTDIGDARVEEIRSDRVIFRRGSERFVVLLQTP